jgi:hypothetical protein
VTAQTPRQLVKLGAKVIEVLNGATTDGANIQQNTWDSTNLH